jgi:hypothetical protein
MRFIIVVAVSALAACSTASNRPPATTTHAPGPLADENGQTGSISYVCTQASCASHARDILDSFKRVEPPTFSGSECQPGLAPGQSSTLEQFYYQPHCRCRLADGGYVHGPPPAGVPPLAPCRYVGRGGYCIWSGEVPDCSPADPNSCESTCQELERVLAEDAKKTFEVRLRFAQCATAKCWLSGETGSGSQCPVIIEVNGQCYTIDSSNRLPRRMEPRDCALSDRELVFPTSEFGPANAYGETAECDLDGGPCGDAAVCAGQMWRDQ